MSSKSGAEKFQNISDLDSLSGADFESLIARLFVRMGFETRVTRATGDGGVDIVATLDHPVTGGRFLIQCKRYAPDSPVGAATVREFYGALVADRLAVKGILITTSTFTAQAQSFARGLPIELIERKQIEDLLAKHGLHADTLRQLVERTRVETARDAQSRRLRYECDLLLLNLGYKPFEVREYVMQVFRRFGNEVTTPLQFVEKFCRMENVPSQKQGQMEDKAREMQALRAEFGEVCGVGTDSDTMKRDCELLLLSLGYARLEAKEYVAQVFERFGVDTPGRFLEKFRAAEKILKRELNEKEA